MRAGLDGAFVISWLQTDIDGLDDAPVGDLKVGATWSWHGRAVRVDGPNGTLHLDQNDAEGDLNKQTPLMDLQLVYPDTQNSTDTATAQMQDTPLDNSFVVTNGAQSFTMMIVDGGLKANPLLMFANEMPPRDTDFWVQRQPVNPLFISEGDSLRDGVIEFAPDSQKAALGLG